MPASVRSASLVVVVVVVVVVTLALVVASGCGIVAGLSSDYRAGDDAGGSSDGGGGGKDAIAFADGGDAWTSIGCPGTAGPTPVRLDTFCIDSTEVTRGDYLPFMNATNDGGATSGQPDVCAGNTTFEPTDDWPPKSGEMTLPVGHVDWCDAYAYCKWAGKRLCGNIHGGANPKSASSDASSSQWFRACSAAGTRALPYGNAYQDNTDGGGACWTDAVPDQTPRAVKTKPNCEGGYPGIFDMSGNVREWEDSCEDAENKCLARGGSINQFGNDQEDCAASDSNPRDYNISPHIGIRCCGDLP